MAIVFRACRRRGGAIRTGTRVSVKLVGKPAFEAPAQPAAGPRADDDQVGVPCM
jgi:hypothetical protein